MTVNSATVRREIIDAGAWQESHIILTSGRHSDVKIDMECLVDEGNELRRHIFLYEMGCLMANSGKFYDACVPIPDGMLKIVKGPDSEMPRYLPKVVESRKLKKGTTKEFRFNHPAARAIIEKAGRIAVLDDVVTTGGTPLAMARAIRETGSKAELDLYAGWRRDKLASEVGQVFAQQFYKVEDPVPSWPASKCKTC